jgi:hypothetical protein
MINGFEVEGASLKLDFRWKSAQNVCPLEN